MPSRCRTGRLKNPATGEWVRTFCIITTAANELVGRIHDRMPAILRPEDYGRWLALDPDGPNLLQPFPSEPMAIWPISTRVNSPKNDDADLLKPLAEATRAGRRMGIVPDASTGTRRMAARWNGDRRCLAGGCDEGRRLSGIWQTLLAYNDGSCGSRLVRSRAHARRPVRAKAVRRRIICSRTPVISSACPPPATDRYCAQAQGESRAGHVKPSGGPTQRTATVPHEQHKPEPDPRKPENRTLGTCERMAALRNRGPAWDDCCSDRQAGRLEQPHTRR